jgi:hypothetical protein
MIPSEVVSRATRLAAVFLSLANLSSAAEAPETAAPATPAAEVAPDESFAVLKERLLKAVAADIAAAEDQRLSGIRGNLLQSLRDLDPTNFPDEADMRRVMNQAPMAQLPPATQKIVEDYVLRLQAEVQAERGRLATEFKAKFRVFAKQGMAATKPAEIAPIRAAVAMYGNDHSDRLGNSGFPDNPVYKVNTFLETRSDFLAAIAGQSWSLVGNYFNQMRLNLGPLGSFIPSEEAEAFLAEEGKRAGILPPDEIQRELKATVDALLDHAQQDQLDAVLQKIKKYQQLYNWSSAAGDPVLGAQWRSLASLAELFVRNVKLVQNGGNPQFSADAWLQSSEHSASVIGRDELIERLKKYRVRVGSQEGEPRFEKLYYDAKEIQGELKATIAALFDDAQQDQLDAILQKIQKYQQISNSSSSGSEQLVANQWRSLASLAELFVRNVKLVQNGGSSQFSPDSWLSRGESPTLIGRDELIERLKNYRVRVGTKEGQERFEKLYYDAREIVDRMRTIEDVAKELPDFRKAVQLANYGSSSGNWAAALPHLVFFAELHEKLASGKAFPLTITDYANMGSLRHHQTGMDERITATVLRLNEESQWLILRRISPGLTQEVGVSPRAAMESLCAKAVEEKHFSAVVLLNQIALVFDPGQPLVPAHELAAVQHYLAGIRQDEDLEEPRLATFYLQKAASVDSTLVPVNDLKSRLQRLKKDHPAAYAQGTDDSLKPGAGENARLAPNNLTIPAAK